MSARANSEEPVLLWGWDEAGALALAHIDPKLLTGPIASIER